MAVKTIRIKISGMSCDSCRLRIEKKLSGITGIKSVHADYITGDAEIICREEITEKTIRSAVEGLGYRVINNTAKNTAMRYLLFAVIIAALYLLIRFTGLQTRLLPTLANEEMGLITLFITGLITSLHCTAMCGGINLSQCLPKSNADDLTVPRTNSASAIRTSSPRTTDTIKPALLYNLGRVCSYTFIGFVVGSVGSALSLSPAMQGALKLAAGAFMIIMGINMLGFFPFLRRLTPRFPKIIKPGGNKNNGPFYVGLLNGLMPCGPLQAMQIYALSTGSAFRGGLAMLVFALGTLPLMLGLGAIVSALGGRFAKKVMTVGALLVAALGISMFSQGWSLAENGGAVNSTSSEISDVSPDASGNKSQLGSSDNSSEAPSAELQEISSTLTLGKYPNISVRAGIPVKWTITAPKGSINGCNNKMLIGEYGIVHVFTPGENIIKFTPDKTGVIRYSCWMGMIRGSITVIN